MEKNSRTIFLYYQREKYLKSVLTIKSLSKSQISVVHEHVVWKRRWGVAWLGFLTGLQPSFSARAVQLEHRSKESVASASRFQTERPAHSHSLGVKCCHSVKTVGFWKLCTKSHQCCDVLDYLENTEMYLSLSAGQVMMAVKNAWLSKRFRVFCGVFKCRWSNLWFWLRYTPSIFS